MVDAIAAKVGYKAAAGIESAWGTAVSVARLLPILDVGDSSVREIAVPRFVDGSGLANTAIPISTKARGTLSLYLDHWNSDSWLEVLLGEVDRNELGPEGNAWDYFWPEDASLTKSMTLVVDRLANAKTTGSVPKWEYPGVKFLSATISGKAGKPVIVDLEFIAKKLVDIDKDTGAVLNKNSGAWAWQYAQSTVLFSDLEKLGIKMLLPPTTIFDFTCISEFEIKIENRFVESRTVETGLLFAEPKREEIVVSGEVRIPNFGSNSKFESALTAFARNIPVEISLPFKKGATASSTKILIPRAHVLMERIEDWSDFVIPFSAVKDVAAGNRLIEISTICRGLRT